MKMVLVLAIAAVAVLAMAGGYVLAGDMGRPMTGCEEQFSAIDTTHRGFITDDQFVAAWSGLGAYKGLGNTGNGGTAFNSADRDANGDLTVREFCDWKTRG